MLVLHNIEQRPWRGLHWAGMQYARTLYDKRRQDLLLCCWRRTRLMSSVVCSHIG